MESFDHVKKDLKIIEDGEAEKDPAFFLKTEGLSEDMKRVMAKLYTPDALKASHLPTFRFWQARSLGVWSPLRACSRL